MAVSFIRPEEGQEIIQELKQLNRVFYASLTIFLCLMISQMAIATDYNKSIERTPKRIYAIANLLSISKRKTTINFSSSTLESCLKIFN